MVKTGNSITPQEMSYLLHMVTLATRRSFSDDEGSIWLHLLSEYSYDECHEAFTHYLRDEESPYLTPGLIIGIIKEKRAQRWRREGEKLTPPNGLEEADYRKWLSERYKEIITPPKAPQVSSLPSTNRRQIEQ